MFLFVMSLGNQLEIDNQSREHDICVTHNVSGSAGVGFFQVSFFQ